MIQVCPFCGAQVDPQTAASGGLPNTRLCPTCGQEQDTPAAPSPPPLFTAAPCDGLATLTEQLGQEGTAPADLAGGPAWEGEGGIIARLWRTTWQMLGHPGRTLATPGLPGLGWSLSYGLILGTLSHALSVFWQVALGWSEMSRSSALWSMFLGPLQVLAILFVTAAVVHAMLFVLGGAKRGFRATFRANAYAQATGVLLVVPGVGLAAGLVWYVVAFTAGLAASHGIGKGRAFSALVLPIFLLFGLVLLIGLVVGFSVLMGMMGGPAGLRSF